MEILLLSFAAIVVILSTILSYYTSINSGSAKLEKWFEKMNKKEK